MEQNELHTIFLQRTEEEVLEDLKTSMNEYRTYLNFKEEWQRLFLAFCTGRKTLPVLYDTVFKRLMNPQTHPERLEDCISCLLGRTVTIRAVLPTEDILMDGETRMVMDILVELEDGSLVLVEIQKVPYYFPAERASCYSADLLLRQYTRVKREKGNGFSYRDLQKVYTIIFYEKSTGEFKDCGGTYVHPAKTVCDSGLELNFLQEYYLVALDEFSKILYSELSNKDPQNRLTGWLGFFCTERPEEAKALCEIYPWLTKMYSELAGYAANPKEMLGMFSEMLREMDKNTIKYMVDDMQEQIEKQRAEIEGHKAEIEEQREKYMAALVEKDAEIEGQKAEIKEQREKHMAALVEKDAEIEGHKAEIERLKKLLKERSYS